MTLLLCWDLDETLGFFRPVGEVLIADAAARGDLGLAARIRSHVAEIATRVTGSRTVPFRLRDGIVPVLDALRERGFRQVVTTGAFPEYAARALELSGLATRFERVFARDVVWDPVAGAKRYAPVLAACGIAPDRAIIIGNEFEKDRSIDPPNMVMICERLGLERPASLLPPVIEALARDGSVHDRFRALFDGARADPVSERTLALAGVSMALGYWGRFAQGERIPVVSDLRPT